MPAFRPKASHLVLVLLAAACALVVVLAMQKRDLVEQLRDMNLRLTGANRGEFVPPAALSTLAGEAVSVATPGSGVRTLFYFNSTCQYCRASLPFVEELASADVGLVGVAVEEWDSIPAYVARHGLTMPVALMRDDRELSLYQTGRIPQLVVVGEDGRIHYARVGAIDAAAVDSARDAAVQARGLATADSIPAAL